MTKSLAALVHDRTFLARRHAELLDLHPLVENLELRTLQVSYRAEDSPLERRALALRFEKLVRRIEREELSIPEALLAGIGLIPLDVSLAPGEFEQLSAQWQRWERRGDGFRWRVRHGCMTSDDVQRAYRRLTGRSESNLFKIRKDMPDLAERARDLLPARKPPNPPGWRYVKQGRSSGNT